MSDKLFEQLQELLIRWNAEAKGASEKSGKSNRIMRATRRDKNRKLTAGGYYIGRMDAYENCADDLAHLVSEMMAARLTP